MPERDVLDLIFRATIREGSFEMGIFGLRLQRHSFDFFAQKLAVLHPGFLNDAQRFRAAFGRTLFIHLTRQDKIEQAISYMKAEQTGLWHMAPDGTELERLAPPRHPAYNADQIQKYYDQFTTYDRDWQSWFDAEDIEPVRISYETLSADPLDTLRKVLDHLGLDRGAAHGVKPEVAKLADSTSLDWAARFRLEQDVSKTLNER